MFTNQLTLNQGESYTLDWISFEGCCAGSSTIRFSCDGGAYQNLDDVNLAPCATAIPEPGSFGPKSLSGSASWAGSRAALARGCRYRRPCRRTGSRPSRS